MRRKRTRDQKKLDQQRHFDYLAKQAVKPGTRLSDKPYILQAVQEDERYRRNGVSCRGCFGASFNDCGQCPKDKRGDAK